MSLLPDWLGETAGQQTTAEAKANYARMQVAYAAQLKARNDQGLISDQVYQQSLSAVHDTLENPTDAGITEFNVAVSEEAAAIPATVTKSVGDLASWTGDIVGKTTSSLGGGLLKGLFGNSVWFTTFAIVALVVIVVFRKPLLKLIKFIP